MDTTPDLNPAPSDVGIIYNRWHKHYKTVSRLLILFIELSWLLLVLQVWRDPYTFDNRFVSFMSQLVVFDMMFAIGAFLFYCTLVDTKGFGIRVRLFFIVIRALFFVIWIIFIFVPYFEFQSLMYIACGIALALPIYSDIIERRIGNDDTVTGQSVLGNGAFAVIVGPLTLLTVITFGFPEWGMPIDYDLFAWLPQGGKVFDFIENEFNDKGEVKNVYPHHRMAWVFIYFSFKLTWQTFHKPANISQEFPNKGIPKTILTRSMIVEKLKLWEAGEISSLEMYKWVASIFGLIESDGMMDYEDWEDENSVSSEVINILDAMDIDLITSEDVPALIEYLETPQGQFEKGSEKWIEYFIAIEIDIRISQLREIEPYKKVC